jgi:hypothetical protein
LYFVEGDFVIVSSNCVRGIIEVKTRVRNSREIKDIIGKLTENALKAKSNFNGLFVYNNENRFVSRQGINDNLKEALIDSRGVVNHISFGKDLFVKYWREGNPIIQTNEPTYSFYRIMDMSFSYFISNLVTKVSMKNDLNDVWYRFPINTPNGKEDFNIFNLDLNA